MGETLARVRALVARGAVRISDHGYDELAADGIFAGEVVPGVDAAVEVEDYPQAAKGPSVLTLQYDVNGRPVHVVWGIPQGRDEPAVLITAYRPDPALWSSDFLKRNRS